LVRRVGFEQRSRQFIHQSKLELTDLGQFRLGLAEPPIPGRSLFHFVHVPLWNVNLPKLPAVTRGQIACDVASLSRAMTRGFAANACPCSETSPDQRPALRENLSDLLSAAFLGIQ
jgi:hypothetical protein